MKNLKVLTLAFAFITAFGISSTFATGNDKANKKNENSRLQTQVVNLIQDTGVEENVSLNGEALVTFSIDDARTIHVKGVFGTNEDLISHIESNLEGAHVNAKEKQVGKEYKIKVNFQDLR